MKRTLLLVGLFLLLSQPVFASFTEKKGIVESEKGWFIWKEFKIGSGIPYWALEIIQPKIAQASELSLKDQIRFFISEVADKYDLSVVRMERISNCESGWKNNAERAIKVVGDKGKSYGLWQFWEKTFLAFEKESGMTDLEYKNWRDQTTLALWAFSNGKSSHWVCK